MPKSNIRKVCWRGRRLIDEKIIFGQLVMFDDQCWIYENPDLKTPIDFSTRGEFIGLPDQNGKEIYEGDLLIISDRPDTYDICVVVWRHCGFIAKKYDSEEYLPIKTHTCQIVGLFYSSELERQLIDIKAKLAELTKKVGEDSGTDDNNNNKI